MLQQTRVDTVIPYYERFLERWPTVEALAGADPGEVRASWSGLGYYRRAQLMLAAAARVTEEHGGRFPQEPEALRALPGFGAYTAGAVASIAYDRPAPAVDGNVQRVLARIAGLRGDPARGETARALHRIAAALAPGESPREWTQALIELGALICTPRGARCDACPVSSRCAALREDAVASIPPPKKRPQRPTVSLTALLVQPDRNTVFLQQRGPSGLFAGLWCLPLFDGHLTGPEVAMAARDRHGLSLRNASYLAKSRHVLTHRELDVVLIGGEPEAGCAPDGLSVIQLDRLQEIGLPSFTTRLLGSGLPGLSSTHFVPGRRTRRTSRASRTPPTGAAR